MIMINNICQEYSMIERKKYNRNGAEIDIYWIKDARVRVISYFTFLYLE